MSTLKTNTIQHLTSGFNNIVTHTDGAGTVNAAHCRAWINFNGATVAIRNSFNVSSLTDEGLGTYTINLTNSMPSTNCCVTSSMHNSDNGGGGDTWPNFSTNNVLIWSWTNTTSSLRVRNAWTNNVNYDGYHNYVSLFY